MTLNFEGTLVDENMQPCGFSDTRDVCPYISIECGMPALYYGKQFRSADGTFEIERQYIRIGSKTYKFFEEGGCFGFGADEKNRFILTGTFFPSRKLEITLITFIKDTYVVLFTLSSEEKLHFTFTAHYDRSGNMVDIDNGIHIGIRRM